MSNHLLEALRLLIHRPCYEYSAVHIYHLTSITMEDTRGLKTCW